MAATLEDLGKPLVLVNESEVPHYLQFLPGWQSIVHEPSEQRDLAIILDCGAAKRVGDSLVERLGEFRQLINIDHHISNSSFGQINCVVPTASSTSELICELALANSLNISCDAALLLLAGITADTGSFRYSSTGARTFELAAKLVSWGAEPARIASALYGQVSRASLALQADAFLRAEFVADGKVALVSIAAEDYERAHATPEQVEGLVEKLRDIQGVQVSAVLKWDYELWRVSLRSRESRYDVNQVAALFGGGGHTMAAAFRSRKDLVQIRAQLTQALCQLVEG